MLARYRFLITRRWLGLTALALVLIAACVYLGIWQHDRYEERDAINERITASQESSHPMDVSQILGVDDPPADDESWIKVRAEGVYDESGQVLIRNRSVDGSAGYEVVTPLILDDGTALFVDRGWIPFADSGATELPNVPPVPSGTVEIIGTVHPSEGVRGTLTLIEGVNQARSINIAELSKAVTIPVMAGFITDADPQEGFTAIPVGHERSWQNFAYAYQWWLFAAMIPIGYVILARREANPRGNVGDRVTETTVGV